MLPGADYGTSYAGWKLDAIRDELTANPAGLVVWVDVELERELAAALWAAEQGGPPVMMIAPTGHIGLTREHLERIRALVMG